jgi:hypothetical protein
MTEHNPVRDQKVEKTKTPCKCANCHCPNHVKYIENNATAKVAADKTTNAG